MYCIAGFGKVKDSKKFAQIANHILRLCLTQTEKKRIDHSRTTQNKVLINSLDVNLKSGPDLHKKIKEHYTKIDAKVKSDSVLAIDLMLTTSPQFFQDASGETWHLNRQIKPSFKKKIDAWVATQLEFVKKEFGENAIKLAVLHLDETTPHIHLVITPEQTKELKYKNQYGVQTKLTTSLNADRWNPAFWKKFLVNYEKANKKFGLRKGEEGSLSQNICLKDFARMVSEASKSNYGMAIKKIVDDIGADLSIVNTKAGVKQLLEEKLLPLLNPMLKQNKALKKLLALDRVNEYKAIKKLKDDLQRACEWAKDKKQSYLEAINEKKHDAELLQQQQNEIDALQKANTGLRSKYEPQKTKSHERSIFALKI